MTALDRPKLIARVSKSLLRRGNPRLEMSLIVVLTGMGGFLASFLFCFTWGWRECGCAIRWPLGSATGCSSCSCASGWRINRRRDGWRRMLSTWLKVKPVDFLSDTGPSPSTHSGSFHWWSDLLPDLDADELLAIVVLVLALLHCGGGRFGIHRRRGSDSSRRSPLGTVVVAALRKRMIRVAEKHWTFAAMRRTAVPFVTVALAFSLAVGIIQQVRPDVRSIGGILHAERPAFDGNLDAGSRPSKGPTFL